MSLDAEIKSKKVDSADLSSAVELTDAVLQQEIAENFPLEDLQTMEKNIFI
jgi:hypothetical protein